MSYRGHFLRLAILFLAAGVGYFLLNRENASSYTIPFIEAQSKEISSSFKNEIAKNLESFSAQAVSEIISKSLQSVEERGKSVFNQLADGAKLKAFEAFKGSFNKGLDNLGATAGIDINNLTPEIQSPVLFSIKSGTLSYFTIKNLEDDLLAYEADWKDGKKNQGEVKKNEIKTLSHSWQQSGQYELNFKVTNKEKTKEYKISIYIF